MDIFRAYDIRGVYPLEINEEIAYNIGRALVVHLGFRNVVVGQDVRSSSPALAKELIRGITDQGADVIDIGLAASPMVYFSVINYGFDGGVSVTASHNSREFNGFKIVDKHAIPLGESVKLKGIKEFPPAEKGEITKKEVLKDYIANILGLAGDVPGLKVAADAGNGMAGLILPELFGQLECQAVPLFWEPDGSFPNHLPNPAGENLNELKKEILEHKANLGIAFDGDADRVVFLDEEGEVIPADFIAALMIKNYFPGKKIIVDLRMSRIVKDVIQETSGQMIESKVGHSFVKTKMFAEKGDFAAELSGHYYLGANHNFESSFTVVLLVLKLMKEKKISELIKPFRKYFNSGELNFEVEDRHDVLRRVGEAYPESTFLDGVSFEADDWWFNLRLSNTEEIVRLVVEAASKDLMEDKKEELMGLIKGKLKNRI